MCYGGVLMEKKKEIVLSICCGLITCGLQFYIIPQFFMRGLSDPIWIGLMVLLPIIPAVMILYALEKSAPKSILWSLLTECFIALVFHRLIGNFLGFHLYSIEWDLFEYVAYFMFTFGWSIATAFAQFIALHILSKYKHPKEI